MRTVKVECVLMTNAYCARSVYIRNFRTIVFWFIKLNIYRIDVFEKIERFSTILIIYV